ncbi:unnamed protein product, partial [Ectocarpus sp. 12 AP-2014]
MLTKARTKGGSNAFPTISSPKQQLCFLSLALRSALRCVRPSRTHPFSTHHHRNSHYYHVLYRTGPFSHEPRVCTPCFADTRRVSVILRTNIDDKKNAKCSQGATLVCDLQKQHNVTVTWFV